MNSRLLLLCLSIFIGSYSFGQTHKSDQEMKNEHSTNMEIIRGTYQVQMIDTRALPSITSNIYKTVNDLRHPTDTIYEFLTPKTRLMILPISIIEREDFKSLEHIKYINN